MTPKNLLKVEEIQRSFKDRRPLRVFQIVLFSWPILCKQDNKKITNIYITSKTPSQLKDKNTFVRFLTKSQKNYQSFATNQTNFVTKEIQRSCNFEETCNSEVWCWYPSYLWPMEFILTAGTPMKLFWKCFVKGFHWLN